MAIEFQRAVPTFRIFSLEKAREFYIDFLGFKVEWEHRFAPDSPVFPPMTEPPTVTLAAMPGAVS